ncbi:MAG: hypothetical protein Tsb0015_01480 [Simkaniaceae bacterium]
MVVKRIKLRVPAEIPAINNEILNLRIKEILSLLEYPSNDKERSEASKTAICPIPICAKTIDKGEK